MPPSLLSAPLLTGKPTAHARTDTGLQATLVAPETCDDAFWSPWAALERRAAAPNPFFGAALLRPAIRHLAPPSLRLLTLTREGRLVFAAPVLVERSLRGLPVTHLVAWRHRYAFLDAPLIDADDIHATLAALPGVLRALPGAPAFLRFALLDREGPAAALAPSTHTVVEAVAERACLFGPFDADAYLEAAIRKKKRKELGRLTNRLSDLGPLTFERLASDNDAAALHQWTEDFLALENRSWKGEQGTSMISRPEDAAYFRAAIKNAHHTGALDVRRLCVDGRTIAMIVNFIAGGEGYSFKIAHDPDFARFSPGVLLEIDLTRAIAAMPDIRLFDSCAAPDHPMIDAIWRERRKMGALTIAAESWRGRLSLAACRRLKAQRATDGDET